ncbi:mandelate racemase/muconate lactonizing enzyme family protein [bacterium]|nr:mandelate racemase/muconate lactonizing enzyme family protein [bacterium]
MNSSRREVLKSLATAGSLACLPWRAGGATFDAPGEGDVVAARQRPVLDGSLFTSPVVIDSIELLRNGTDYFVRVRSSDGAEGLAVSHSEKMNILAPIFLSQVAPFFKGKDARSLERLLEGVYVHDSNYKMQGQAFWICVASLEFALLDLLGRVARKPLGGLVGPRVRRSVQVYQASSRRGNTPEDEVEKLKRTIARTGAKAVKIRLGGRMSNNADSLPGRTDTLIPLARRELGDSMTLYGDANGSYDVTESIRVGRLLEESGYAFFEEPCPFDYYEETRQIADALTIPVAGGECEGSLRQFQWMIQNGVVQVVQPDLFYFGGFIRSVRVARMAETAGIPCTVHISGGGLGYLYMLHFASCVPNIGPFQEYKGDTAIPLASDVSLTAVNGSVDIPNGDGLGVTIDPAYIAKCQPVS